MKSLIKSLTPYNKLFVALAGAVGQVISQFFGNKASVQIVLAVLTALGVYQVKNR